MARLLGVSSDAKTIKGEARGFLTGILYLSPHTSGGTGNLCADASAGCIAGCLYHEGRATAFPAIHKARQRKTRELKANRPDFLARLSFDIASLERTAIRRDMIPAVRLNGTSDIPWEHLPMADAASIMDAHPTTTFYDYTKSLRRMRAYLAGSFPENYSLTFSRSECNEAACDTVLSEGGNVAVVFAVKRGAALPTRWHGRPVIDGDLTDLRFTDGHIGGGQVIGVRAKGAAKRDTSGFVVIPMTGGN